MTLIDSINSIRCVSKDCRPIAHEVHEEAIDKVISIIRQHAASDEVIEVVVSRVKETAMNSKKAIPMRLPRGEVVMIQEEISFEDLVRAAIAAFVGLNASATEKL